MKYVIGVILVFLACFLTEYIADTLSDRLDSWLGTIVTILFAVVMVAIIMFFSYKFGIYREW